jgi:hypothetical protein
MLFTRQFTEWAWYYVVPVLVGAMALALLEQWALRRFGRMQRYVSATLAGCVMVCALGLAILDKRGGNRDPRSLRTLEVVQQQGWHGQVLLLSEFPGITAFHSDNHIVAADMLTSNRSFFEAMERAPDALVHLLERCRAAGKPVDYIVWNVEPWLVPAPDLRSLRYYSPKRTPELVQIGELELPPPVFRTETGPEVIVWDLRPAAGQEAVGEGFTPSRHGGSTP